MSLNKAHEHHNAFPKDEPAIIFIVVAMWCSEFLLHNTLYQAEIFGN